MMTYTLEDVYRIIEHHESEPDRIVMVDVVLFMGDEQVRDYQKGTGSAKLRAYFDNLDARGMYPDAARIMIYPTARGNEKKFNSYTNPGRDNVFDVVFTDGYFIPPFTPSGVSRYKGFGSVPQPTADGLNGTALGALDKMYQARLEAEIAKLKAEAAEQRLEQIEAKLEEIEAEREKQRSALNGLPVVLAQYAPLVPVIAGLLGVKSPVTTENAAGIANLASTIGSIQQPQTESTQSTQAFYQPRTEKPHYEDEDNE